VTYSIGFIEKHAMKNGLEPSDLLAVLNVVLRGQLGISLFSLFLSFSLLSSS
jgi:hypothetical protein